MVASQIFWWSMVASQIFVEHGHFLKKSLNCGQAGPKIKCSTKIWGHLSHFGGAWSFLFFDGHFSNFGGTGLIFEKALDCGQVGLKKCSTKIWEMTMFHQILRPFVTFWWNTVIFIFWWSMVASHIFWSMVASQIFLEHGRFSNFSGAWSFFKFCWNMRIFLSKALGWGQVGPKTKSLPGGWKFKKMNTSIYRRFLEPKNRVPP